MVIRVAVFDDNKKFRESLAVLVAGTPGLELAGAFANASDAVKDIAACMPDVVLMDIEMPALSGIEALREIKKVYPRLAVLMQTVFEEDDKVFESICSGASGYILKNTAPARMLESIREAYEGGAPMTPIIARKVLGLMQRQHLAGQAPAAENFSLTAREKEVLGYMVSGMSYKMIAAQCNISFETVRSHIRNIYEKLHVATMTEAVAKAIKSGIV